MKTPGISWISASDPPETFPPAEYALSEPDGLLAAGGDLSDERLLYAYRHGIFPWYEDGQPVLWWSPDPRCVVRTDELHISRRTARALAKSGFTVEFNRRFTDVVDACAAPRDGQRGTWITPAVRDAFVRLRQSGWAHSIEVCLDGRLLGGLYGLAIGRIFFGESMFRRETNASKAAMLAVCRITGSAGFPLLDCQVASPHLLSMGATMMPRAEFLDALGRYCYPLQPFGEWPEAPVDVVDLLGQAPAVA